MAHRKKPPSCRAPEPNKRGQRFIYRASRICPKSGRRLYARDYGLRAWKIPVDE